LKGSLIGLYQQKEQKEIFALFKNKNKFVLIFKQNNKK
jgi:hypothetical protein